MKRQMLGLLTMVMVMIGTSAFGGVLYTNICSVSEDLYIQWNEVKITTGATFFAGNSGGTRYRDRRIFMQFDMSAIDPDAVIVSATLKLYHVEGSGDGNGSAFLREITAPWSTASITNDQPVGASLGTIVAAAGPFNEYKEMNVTSVIQGWGQDVDSHHGFSVRGSETWTATAKYFHSADGANPPELTIVWGYNVASLDVDEDLYITSGGVKTDDNRLIAGNPGTPSEPRRAFMKFDMTPLTDLGSNLARINQATLRLYHVEGTKDDYGGARLYEITAPWEQSTVTYGQTVSAGFTSIVGNAGPFNEYKDLDVTTELQAWLADPSVHHGFSIRSSAEGSTVTGKYFHSSTGGNPPVLFVSYERPAGTVISIR